jgi:ribonuclease HI
LIEVYIDGASAGDPGPSGAGIFIKPGSGIVERHAIPLGRCSNHEAEYLSLIKALELCIEKGYQVLSVKTDSQLVERAVVNRFVKNAKYKNLLEHILSLTEKFDLFFVKWVPGKDNKVADELARKAIHLNK